MPVSKKCWITARQQKIMILLCNSNKREIIYEEQTIYKNRRTFNESMKKLANANWIEVRSKKHNSRFKNHYKISLTGLLIAEEIIKDFIDKNE